MKMLIQSLDADQRPYVVEITPDEWNRMCPGGGDSVDYEDVSEDLWPAVAERPELDATADELSSMNRLVCGY